MGRLVPDPSVAVCDLQQVITQFCKESGSNDIHTLLAPVQSRKVSWKTAPDPEWLHQMSPFFRQTGTCCKEPGDFIKEAQVGHGQGSVPSHLT